MSEPDWDGTMSPQEQQYVEARDRVVALLGRARELLDAATLDDARVTWGHVGSMDETARKLGELVAWLEGGASC